MSESNATRTKCVFQKPLFFLVLIWENSLYIWYKEPKNQPHMVNAGSDICHPKEWPPAPAWHPPPPTGSFTKSKFFRSQIICNPKRGYLQKLQLQMESTIPWWVCRFLTAVKLKKKKQLLHTYTHLYHSNFFFLSKYLDVRRCHF